MRKILILLFVLVIGTPAYAGEASLGLSTGYRVDNLDWNIAGNINGQNPNILSELTWSDLQIIQLKLSGKVIAGNPKYSFYGRGELGYGYVMTGDNQDSDYAGNNRTLEFSRSNNTGGGEVVDGSIAVGMQFSPISSFKIAPVIGYALNYQYLTITDGYSTIPATGSFSGLNSTYDAKWEGPFVGVDISLKTSEKLTIFGSAEYRFETDYYAESDWNLRTDFIHPKSYEHKADGSGYVLAGGIDYIFSDGWSISLTGDYRNFSTDNGTDTTFFTNGTTTTTRLNEVNWDSYSCMFGLEYKF